MSFQKFYLGVFCTKVVSNLNNIIRHICVCVDVSRTFLIPDTFHVSYEVSLIYHSFSQRIGIPLPEQTQLKYSIV